LNDHRLRGGTTDRWEEDLWLASAGGGPGCDRWDRERDDGGGHHEDDPDQEVLV
jgi:hypothetical protein